MGELKMRTHRERSICVLPWGLETWRLPIRENDNYAGHFLKKENKRLDKNKVL